MRQENLGVLGSISDKISCEGWGVHTKPPISNGNSPAMAAKETNKNTETAPYSFHARDRGRLTGPPAHRLGLGTCTTPEHPPTSARPASPSLVRVLGASMRLRLLGSGVHPSSPRPSLSSHVSSCHGTFKRAWGPLAPVPGGQHCT